MLISKVVGTVCESITVRDSSLCFDFQRSVLVNESALWGCSREVRMKIQTNLKKGIVFHVFTEFTLIFLNL